MAPPRRPGGFSLVELLITIAILSIITTFAVGSYRSYLRRANRVDATSALLRIASAQERFYLQNGQYAAADDLAVAPPAGLGISGTERGYYTLTITLPGGGATAGYLATATIDSSGPQADDTECGSFSVDNRGMRSAADSGGGTGAEITERCWR